MGLGKEIVVNKVRGATVDNWFDYLPFYDNYLHRLCKAIDDILLKFVTVLLADKRLKHKLLFKILDTRMKLSCFRGEKWIRRMWMDSWMRKEALTGYDHDDVVYIMTQFYSKKRYVGETDHLATRIAKHMYESRKQKVRHIYVIITTFKQIKHFFTKI